MPELMTMTAPVLALIVWTLVMWVWLYATRLPAMSKAGINPGKIKRKEDIASLPVPVQQVADNYNHLHEQPTIFYALAIYSQIVGVADELNIGLAWGYVLLRIVHSVYQSTVNYVPVRFFIFAGASIVLMVMAARNVFALFA